MATKPTEEEIIRFADMFSAMGTVCASCACCSRLILTA
jgi:hypothetical protein